MANQYFVFKSNQKLVKTLLLTIRQLFITFYSHEDECGEKIQLVFEEGKVGLAEVVSSELCTVRLLEVLEVQTELPVHITVALGFLKAIN